MMMTVRGRARVRDMPPIDLRARRSGCNFRAANARAHAALPAEQVNVEVVE